MKTSKQDIQDLLAAIANDIEEIKAMLNGNGNTAGVTTNTSVVADAGAAGKDNAISNDVAVSDPATTDITAATDYAAIGNGSVTANPDRIIAEVTRLLEPISQTCSKLPGRLKSYCAQLLLRIPKDLREELTRDNDARKRKGKPTVEDKIDNSLTILISIYDRLNKVEDAMRPSTPKSKIIAWLKSVWSSGLRFCTKQPARWYRKPHILCVVVIYLLYFALSIYSWQQWHYYRTENTHLRLTADKYRVDSIILRELYPQATITLSAYEHFTESEGADAAINIFRENTNAVIE